MARTKKAATKTTAKTASVSETPAKSVVTASEEKAVQAETPKTDDAKASVETKAAEKTAEVKPETPAEKKADTKPAEEKTAAVKTEEPVKKPAAKKTTTRKTTTAKKTTTRKTATAKKAETVTEVYVQYWGKEIHTSEVADRIKKIWTDDMGKKATDLKDLKIYIKPEDNGAHYVINGDVTGFIGL